MDDGGGRQAAEADRGRRSGADPDQPGPRRRARRTHKTPATRLSPHPLPDRPHRPLRVQADSSFFRRHGAHLSLTRRRPGSSAAPHHDLVEERREVPVGGPGGGAHRASTASSSAFAGAPAAPASGPGRRRPAPILRPQVDRRCQLQVVPYRHLTDLREEIPGVQGGRDPSLPRPETLLPLRPLADPDCATSVRSFIATATSASFTAISARRTPIVRSSGANRRKYDATPSAANPTATGRIPSFLNAGRHRLPLPAGKPAGDPARTRRCRPLRAAGPRSPCTPVPDHGLRADRGEKGVDPFLRLGRRLPGYDPADLAPAGGRPGLRKGGRG